MDYSKKYLLISFWAMSLLLGGLSASAAEAVSLVTKTVGETSLVRQEEDQGPGLGMKIVSGDRLETGIASILDASLNSRVGLRLLPLTKVVVLRLDTEEPQIQILQGNVIGLVRKSSRTFKAETPDADMKIQAGQFWARYEKEKSPSATFSSLEGEAKISPKNSSAFVLDSKKAADINQGAAAESRWASPAELQAVKQAEDIEIQ